MKKNAFFLMFSLLGFNTLILAQSNEFLRGYFITPARDTVRGYIQDRTKISQSEIFYFKTDLAQTEAATYTPEQAEKYFYEPNFIFQSMTIEREGKREKKFLRQLVTGYAALFEYNTADEPLYVLTKASGESVQLEKKDTIVGGHLKEDHRYLGKMMALFKDCNQFLTRTNRIDFTQNMLSRFVYQYNRCAHPEEESKTMTVVRKLRVNFGPTGGLSFVKVHTNNYNAALHPGTGEGNGFELGLLLNFSYIDKLAVRSGVVYHSYDFLSQEEYSFGFDNYRHIIKALEFPINVKYRITNGKISPFLYGGIIFPVYLEKTLNTQRNELGTVITDADTKIDITSSLTFNGGIGISCKVFQDTDVQFNVGYQQLNVEFGGNRTFETNTLLFTMDILF